MAEFETLLERGYAADGDQRTLAALYDDRAQDWDRQIRASGNSYIGIAADRRELLDRSRLFLTYRFSEQEARLAQTRARLNRIPCAGVNLASL